MRPLNTLKEGFLDLLWPPRCVGCDAPGTMLCATCEEGLPFIDASDTCPRCGAAHGAVVCTECTGREPFVFTGARAVGSFDDALARMVVVYKDSTEKRLAPVIARLMAQAAGPDWRSWADYLAFVPASSAAFRRRGFDHMELLASELSSLIRIPLADVLFREGTKKGRKLRDQRELGREEREGNVSGSFGFDASALAPDALHGARVLLVDDVFTTGATLDEAARVLLAGGVGEVRVLVAARVW